MTPTREQITEGRDEALEHMGRPLVVVQIEVNADTDTGHTASVPGGSRAPRGRPDRGDETCTYAKPDPDGDRLACRRCRLVLPKETNR